MKPARVNRARETCTTTNNTQVSFDSELSHWAFYGDTLREIGGGVAVGAGFHGSIWDFVGPDHGSFSQRQTSGTTPMPFDLSVTGDVSGRRSIEIRDFGASAIADFARPIGEGRWAGRVSVLTTFNWSHTSFTESLTDLRSPTERWSTT